MRWAQWTMTSCRGGTTAGSLAIAGRVASGHARQQGDEDSGCCAGADERILVAGEVGDPPANPFLQGEHVHVVTRRIRHRRGNLRPHDRAAQRRHPGIGIDHG